MSSGDNDKLSKYNALSKLYFYMNIQNVHN